MNIGEKVLLINLFFFSRKRKLSPILACCIFTVVHYLCTGKKQ